MAAEREMLQEGDPGETTKRGTRDREAGCGHEWRQELDEFVRLCATTKLLPLCGCVLGKGSEKSNLM